MFEYLGAAGAKETTKIPGEDSFTSALIWALETLVKRQPEGRFTTSDLANEITKHKDFPRDQKPVLYERQIMGAYGGRIMLQPLQNSESEPQTPSKDNANPGNRHTVSLHWEFSRKPSKYDIERLGHEVNDLLERNWNLGLGQVRWGGIRSMQAILSHAASALWLNVERSKQRRLSENGLLSPYSTSPLPRSPTTREISPSSQGSSYMHGLTSAENPPIEMPEFAIGDSPTSLPPVLNLEPYDHVQRKRQRDSTSSD